MANLESLGKKSISRMSEDELIDRLRELRLARRTPALPQKREKKAKPTVVLSTSSLIDKLSPDQIAMLLEKLGGQEIQTQEETNGTDTDAGEVEDLQD